MKTRPFVILITTFALLTAACGGETDSASEAVDEVSSAETVVEVESTTTTTEAAEEPETTTTTEAAEEPETTTTTEAAEELETTTTTEAAEQAEIPAAPIDAMAIYESNCANCHSSDGSGGRGGSLQGIEAIHPDTAFGIEIVKNGATGMPDFADKLTEEEIEAVVNYVWETF